ncbi:MAG TPA: methyltransferase domain-containing protein, partial [Bacteroidetes bacterium]|nr:methyltransferase domain-containing protein [Bacteroidota bacterium]
HIFIKHGLEYLLDNKINKSISILEYGFGTGLNALLAMGFSFSKNIHIDYTGIEAYPISISKVEALNYPKVAGLDYLKEEFYQMHIAGNSYKIEFGETFIFTKVLDKFENFKSEGKYDIIFYDVFGPESQPHLWERSFLDEVVEKIKPQGGILITYGAKGSFKRALKSLGLAVENLPGPPGKREITRALKY